MFTKESCRYTFAAQLVRFKNVLMALALVGMLFVFAVPGSTYAQAAAPRNVSLSELTDNTAAYIGQLVTVRGDLVGVVGSNAFRLDDEAALGGDTLLVVGARRNLSPFAAGGFENAVSGGVNMQVTGIVRAFNMGVIENEIGYDLDNGLFEGFEGQAAIVARNIDVIGTLSDIADNTNAYLGLPVTVYGDIVDVVTPTAFRIDDPALLGGDSVLVVAANQNIFPAATIFDPGVFDSVGGNVSALVTGVVRRGGDANAIRNEVGYNLDPGLFGEAEDAVLVASNVNVVGTVSRVADNSQAYRGATVTVQGDVVERISPTAFRLDDDATLGADTILVVSANPNPGNIPGNAVVTGKVRTFNIVDIENEIGYDLDDNLFGPYAGQAVIVANAIVPDNN